MAIAPRLLSYLDQHAIAFDIVRHPKTETAAQSAKQAQVDPEHLAKAVLLVDEAGYLLVAIPTSHWVMLDRINELLGRNLELASEAEVDRMLIDCQPGAIPAVGKAYGIDTLVDEALFSLAFVYIEAGDHEQLLAVSQAGFETLMTGARKGHYCRLD